MAWAGWASLTVKLACLFIIFLLTKVINFWFVKLLALSVLEFSTLLFIMCAGNVGPSLRSREIKGFLLFLAYFSNKNVFNLNHKAWLSFLGVFGVADSESDVLWPLRRHFQGHLRVKWRRALEKIFKNQFYMFLGSLILNRVLWPLWRRFKVI